MAELKFLRGLLTNLPASGRTTDNFYVTTGDAEGDYRLYLGDILLAQGDVVERLVALESLMGEGGEGSVSERIETAISDLKDELTATITAETAAREAEVSGLTATVEANKTEIEGKLADAVAAIEEAAAEETARVNKKIADDIAAESALRVAAEGDLSKAIEAETTTARAAEKANADAISAETAARVAAVNAINATIGEVAEGTTVVEMIEAVSADAKSYSIAKVEGDELADLGTNVKEAFKLVDEDGAKAGEYIKVYKDSALQSVSLVEQELVFTYLLVDGTKSVVGVDVSKFLAESEFADGLQVVDHVVSVKVDETSEAFLTVSADGVKLSGVQTAINTAVAAERDRAVSAETANANAITAETAARKTAIEDLDAEVISEDGTHVTVKVTEVDGVITAVNVTESDIASETATTAAIEAEATARTAADDAINAKIGEVAEGKTVVGLIEAEATAARAAEKENADAIAAEKSRAEGKEGELAQAIADEKAAREEAISNLSSATTASIDEVNANLTAEMGRAVSAETALSDRLDDIEAVEVTGEDAIVVSASGATENKKVSLKLATQPAEGEAGVVLSQTEDGLKATLQWGSF